MPARLDNLEGSRRNPMVDARTLAQVDILRAIQQRLARAHVRWWLRGGWAIDFMLGQITRCHGDIDIVVWSRHRQRVRQALQDAGLTPAREWVSQSDFRLGDEVVSVIYLTRGPD